MPPALSIKKSFGRVQCRICPHLCVLGNSKAGKCGVRAGRQGDVVNIAEGKITGYHFAPIEAALLYHINPTRSALHVGVRGETLPFGLLAMHDLSGAEPPQPQFAADELVYRARAASGCKMLSFSYGEPSPHLEYIRDAAEVGKRNGIEVAVVTNGFLTPEAADGLADCVAAAAIWLHSPDPSFYRHYTGKSVDAVLNAIRILKSKGVLVEVLHQIIATQTDHPKQMQRLRDTLCSLDPALPVHLERFVQVKNYDVPATSGESMRLAYEILREKMPFVYVREGNISEMNDTMCAECGHTLAHRQGDLCDLLGVKEKRCIKCGTAAPFRGI